ncbi:hypothetical protein IOD16_23540 [Saccharothrix sp. 6-C]|uniref:hypothetical protein n=1 Tax=Saccharothrix sp. 6-C TaxID=2781735 RepID=UPI0019176D4E|nr:hypothetical protein [Saccharothrix sp. 6-C]QQQ74181.1 hypothetical protein IOD16_23540 [Saccharothrix sp. 6-C]
MNKEPNFSLTRGRALLAVLLVSSVVANVATQAFGLSSYISAAFGMVAVASGVTLFSSYRKNLKSSRK